MKKPEYTVPGKIKFSLFCILFLVQTAHSTTHYVTTTGSNGNPGSQSLPWLTIQYAANHVNPGDTVLVATGTYNERVNINIAGQPGQKIIFLAQPARTVYMHGFLVGAPYNSFEGFDITTSEYGWQGGGFWVASNYIDILNNFIHNIPGAGIQATWGATSSWARHVYVSQNKILLCDEGMDVEGYNWLIENNEVERPLYAGLSGDYSRFFGDSITFRHNFFHGARISEVGGAHVDGFQYFDNNGEFATNIVIEGNYVESFDEGVILESTNPAGSTSNIIIRNNVFIGGELGGAWGVCVKDNIRHGLEVVNNLFADLQYHGVGLMVNSEGIVQNNTFFNGGSNYWADATSTVQGGYNILNHTAYPYYSDPNDLVNRNPMMVDTLNFTGADSLPFTCDDGYHLQSVSPAIDAGISTVAYGVLIDIFGTPRPTGPSYDIGPVEYTLIGLNAFNNGPGCVGNTIDLSSNPTGGTVPFTYFWAGPNSFTSNLSNPVLSNATVAMSGTYTVMITDAQGCSSSDTTTVTVRPLPDPADSITGTSTLCAGVTNVAYFVSPILNAVNYVWTLPPGATIITGNGSNNIAVDYSLNATSGNISVYGINTCGDGLVSPDFPVVVNPTPAAPIITLSGDTMVSNAYQGNQWYLDNVLIPGATGQRYVAAQLGVYWDLVSLNGCSSDTSNHLYFVVGIAEKNIPGIFISPVPNNGNFKLTIGTALRGKFTISVYNNTGVKIFEAEREVIDGISDYPVDLRPAASGVYTVVLSDNSTEMAKPFLICK